MRALLYALARLIGDFNAVKRGPGATGKRVGRRIVGRGLGRLMRAIFR